MILATNILVLVASGVCMINNAFIIAIGRFLYGMAAGAFTVFTPKFINEVAPPEYKGPFGALSQFMCTFGILCVALMGIAIPNDPYAEDINPDSFIVTQYWRVVWGMPAVLVVI